MLPAETAVPKATLADIAEIHAVTAIETAETSVMSAETKINEENHISHESQSIKQNIVMRNATPPLLDKDDKNHRLEGLKVINRKSGQTPPPNPPPAPQLVGGLGDWM